jgi:tRNA A37 threonylcarbamoyladenosine dehydratase
MDPDTERRFAGVRRLYGMAGFERLQAAHVCVVGIGGVGAWAAEALARSAVGRLTLVDLDHVAESNINRQVHALTDTLGQAKVLAMAQRIALINPACAVHPVEDFVTPDNLDGLVPACDAVLDAIDQVRAKAALIAHCKARGLPLVITGGAGGRTDPTRLRCDDLARTTQDALASKVRARLRKEYGFPRGPKAKFGVPCIYSDEPIRRPGNAACDLDPGAPHASADTALHGLNCAGYGSSVCVTAAFGLAAAAWVLDLLASG